MSHKAFHKMMEANYIALGRFISTWDRVEASCSVLFDAIWNDELSQIAFFASTAFNAKHKLISRSLEKRPTTIGSDEIAKALKRLETLSRRRNDVIHGTWVTLGPKPEQTFRVAITTDHDKTAEIVAAFNSKDPRKQKMTDRVYTAERLLKLSEEIQDLANSLSGYAEQIFKAREQADS